MSLSVSPRIRLCMCCVYIHGVSEAVPRLFRVYVCVCVYIYICVYVYKYYMCTSVSVCVYVCGVSICILYLRLIIGLFWKRAL